LSDIYRQCGIAEKFYADMISVLAAEIENRADRRGNKFAGGNG
jgi:hypothetical protein